MTIRLNNLGKWSVLSPGDVLQLSGDEGGGARRIRVQVNTTGPTRFDVTGPSIPATFLGVVDGLEDFDLTVEGTVEFVASPAAEDGEVYYFTQDGRDDSFEGEHPSLVSIMNRPIRNRSEELMMAKARQNSLRRIAYDEAQALQRIEAFAKAAEERVKNGNGDGAASAGAGGAATAPVVPAADAGGEAGAAKP